MKKLEYDYDKIRTSDEVLEQKDYDYIKRDVEILCDALYKLRYEWDIKEDTLASAGMRMLKESWIKKYGEILHLRKNQGERVYRYFLPELEEEEHNFVSLSYKGGLVYLNPQYMDIIMGDGENEIGMVLDANSMYGSVMLDEVLPCGKGIYYNSEYKRKCLCDDLLKDCVSDFDYHPLYVERFRCAFKLKEGGIPFLMLKNDEVKYGYNRDNDIHRYIPINTALTSSEKQVVELVMTNIDFLLFMKNYDFWNYEVVDGYFYKGITGLFDDYLNHWGDIKKKAVLDGDEPTKNIAKLMISAIGGKFGTKVESSWKMVYLDNGVLKTKTMHSKKTNPEYIPIISFITSYARQRLCEVIEEVRKIGYKFYDKDIFVYCDTDSCHFLLKYEQLPDWFIEQYIDKLEFSKWKVENKIYKSVYLRNKTYLEQKVKNSELTDDYDKNYKASCSGFPKKKRELINFENFRKGVPFKEIKLVPKQVEGGCALVLEDFSIKK